MLEISENWQIFVHNFGGVAKMSLVSFTANLPPRTQGKRILNIGKAKIAVVGEEIELIEQDPQFVQCPNQYLERGTIKERSLYAPSLT
ncbi:MAG: hypothetical protein AAGF26_07240 [Cyanobacteria bacterium P01_G01_bin.49]